ncbi:MAG: SDR family oxidoreductase [Gammaproteobacteria bacterium]|nr:SDR family oxidoreductase [Acidobacteriota bacterium]MBM4225972.1 SDR family oxidoreductase [Gammaproteobacteria bacterium]
MKSRIILITGANGGIGQAIARAFFRESGENFVYLGVRQRRDAAEQLATEFPDRCALADLDVAQLDAWRALIQRIVARHQRLDVLVNNAGFHLDSLLAQMSPDTWRSVLDTNLDGTFHGCQAVLPTMILQRHGRIVNIASLSALAAPAGQTNYAAAKAGVVALTQSLAKEVARIGITVNVLCPGFIESESLPPLDSEARKAMVARIPMRRIGRPEEVAAAVKFLASAEADYITGSTLKVDGGIL